MKFFLEKKRESPLEKNIPYACALIWIRKPGKVNLPYVWHF